MKCSPVRAVDEKIIARQLGRAPRGLSGVAKRCDKGFPQIILNLPLVSSSIPFPTLHWLTCPHLNKRIAQLEGDGLVKRLEDEIGQDPHFRNELLEAHKDYKDLLNEAMQLMKTAPGYAIEGLADKGIAGVSDFSKIKCLHAHFAHYLITEKNPIGARVQQLIDDTPCLRDCGDAINHLEKQVL